MTQINTQSNIEYGDIIEQLPSDNTYISDSDKKLINDIFQPLHTTENKKGISSVFSELKSSIIIGIIFFIISLPQMDSVFKRIINSTNIYVYLLMKMVIFIIVVWMLKNFNLIKSK